MDLKGNHYINVWDKNEDGDIHLKDVVKINFSLEGKKDDLVKQRDWFDFRKEDIRKDQLFETHVNQDTGTPQLQGGEWLVKDQTCQEIFILEEFSSDDMMMADACTTFMKTEVEPKKPEFET